MSRTRPRTAPTERRRLRSALSRFGVLTATAALLGTAALATAPAASAATSYTATAVSAKVTGTSVTATAKIASSASVTAQYVGVCARTSNGGGADFAFDSGAVTSAGRVVTKTKTMNYGTYTYWPCLKVNGTWTDLGPKQSFTVSPPAPPAAAPAGTNYGVTDLTAKVDGTSVTVSAKFTASNPVTAQSVGFCARDEAGLNADFAFDSGAVNAAGKVVSKTKSYTPGSYSYWPCIKVGNTWTDIGSKKGFRVADPKVAEAVKANTSLPIGDQPGWKQVFTEDFTTDVAQGGFPGPYADKWTTYDGFNDTTGNGRYNDDIISTSNGVLDINLRSMNGKPQVSAPVPLVSGAWGGQKYGKFSVRFRADALQGYKTAWLLWPTSGNWNEGEIDFPEGELNGNMWGFNHCPGNPANNCGWVNTYTGFTDWHIATIEWTPKAVKLILDGETLLNQTTNVPQNPMHWVLQTETTSNPNLTVSGKVQIDWATVYSYNP
ncbi:glycoside hydrolase family 16 protein [Nakamurella leprariae]|uniref:Glycoside hydrolase family 16 protein n=1 Tax=Nakamurella leprariae TaxID=2803911 RepID=A0A938Y4I0_9ACTN|nr:glycoside hydrolase family 16 protein [Nakamurella leprariae]MBM9465916.1 glycoside hydrolase family 16 protein [Nakamurella leprariae]